MNIPFVDVFAQMPSYAKFMKKILTNKKKLEDLGTLMLNEECSAILQNEVPPKLKDPVSFTISCTIGNMKFDKVLCDLGASIKLMPYSIFRKLNLGEVKATSISLQLADRSIKFLMGIIEDILVKVTFNVFSAIKYPIESDSCLRIDMVDLTVEETFILEHPQDHLENLLVYSRDKTSTIEEVSQIAYIMKSAPPIRRIQFEELGSGPSKPLPSVQKVPILELKQLPSHLRYAYLGESSTLAVIIANEMTELEEQRLLRVLTEYKIAIGWSIANIRGISPSICMHKILMEEEYKPIVEN
ncbi:uncharacterized protein LOC111398335 [Olea europaea var. sylvestris]|uniref:uncharacterized protein LOC111398335 n=1 Tax=Olea europaea var. sylvestris TaxID=158386 RepID=UPI000C1D25D3|nr:uncharacterized protein LOC111398335 [Olea europaea var. sylvestris]